LSVRPVSVGSVQRLFDEGQLRRPSRLLNSTSGATAPARGLNRIAMLKRIIVRLKAVLAAASHRLRHTSLPTFLLAACLPLLAACGGAKIEAAPRADPRMAVQLSADEDEHLRSGMRAYLESIQGIVGALARNKMADVASNAKRAGMGMVDDVPVSAVLKLPPAFVILSIDTHQKFDALSRLAEEPGSKSVVLAQLREILANCTACHSAYRTSLDRR